MTDIRCADPDDRLQVLRVLEGALLDVDPEQVESAIVADHVLVTDDPITGALVAESRERTTHITALAVTPDRRRNGIGATLVEEAVQRWGTVSAAFDDHAYPFYAAMNFSITDEDGRWRGRYPPV